MSWRPGMPVAIETERYFLRSMGPTDVTNRYLDWAGDAELMDNLASPAREITRDQLVAYIKKFDNRTRFHLGVFTKESGLHIGFYTVTVTPKTLTAQTAVVIGDRDYWGEGVVMETRTRLIDFIFDDMRLQRIWGTPLERNFPSIFNYKAQGFTCEGILRKHGVRANGERADLYVFGLLRDEWYARRGTPDPAPIATQEPEAPVALDDQEGGL